MVAPVPRPPAPLQMPEHVPSWGGGLWAVRRCGGGACGGVRTGVCADVAVSSVDGKEAVLMWSSSSSSSSSSSLLSRWLVVLVNGGDVVLSMTVVAVVVMVEAPRSSKTTRRWGISPLLQIGSRGDMR